MSKVKIAKAAVGAAFVAAVASAFFFAPTSILCRFQPSASFEFLASLLLALVFGRLFCECFCPLGVLQSFVSFVFHPRSKVRRVCTRLPETKAQRIVRWTVFAVFAALLASGFGALAWTLTPYSIFGKALTLFAPGVALFAAVLVSAAFGKGRFWCNWICPAGTLFNLLAKKAAIRHSIGPGCSKCKACFPQRETDGGGRSGAKPEGGVTRRDALKGVAVLAAADAVEKTVDGGFADVAQPGVPERGIAALPPGAAPRGAFDLKCVGCGLCIKNCRGGCLSASSSLSRFGQPEMDFRKGWCLTGCKQACAAVCPTGAISPLGGIPRADVHVGHAEWTRSRCIRETEGVQCTACSRKCPVKAIHIVNGFPVVDRNKCIGCGACEHVCPARPLPAIWVKGYDSQRVVSPVEGPAPAAGRKE